MPLVNEGLLVVSPEHCLTLARGGVRSKADLSRRLFRECNRALTKHAPSMFRHLLLPKLVSFLRAKLGYLGCVRMRMRMRSLSVSVAGSSLVG